MAKRSQRASGGSEYTKATIIFLSEKTTSKSAPILQKRARPPKTPTESTHQESTNFNLSQMFLTFGVLIFVYDKKIISGLAPQISFLRALIVEALPAPRQFHAIVLMARWGA